MLFYKNGNNLNRAFNSLTIVSNKEDAKIPQSTPYQKFDFFVTFPDLFGELSPMLPFAFKTVFSFCSCFILEFKEVFEKITLSNTESFIVFLIYLLLNSNIGNIDLFFE